MAKVDINSAGHQVTIEADGDLGNLIEKAQRLWDETKPPGGTSGVGFTSHQAVPTVDSYADLRIGERMDVR